jgi:heat shock protein HslJ
MKYVSILLIAVIGFQCSPKLSPDSGWGNQRWVLVELKGVPVQQSESRRDAYIGFEVADKRFTGNGGCNQISGNYTLDKNDIRFTEVVSTKMSCSDIEFENAFLSALSSIDGYEVRGNDLLLKRKQEVMARLRSR